MNIKINDKELKLIIMGLHTACCSWEEAIEILKPYAQEDRKKRIKDTQILKSQLEMYLITE